MYSPGSTDVFVIALPEGEDILVAAIADNIRKIDWERKKSSLCCRSGFEP